MALKTHTVPSPSFVESCGAILFSPTYTHISLLKLLPTNTYTLPKGRRNMHESRSACALREVREETGCRCTLVPIRMATRQTAADDPVDVPDVPRVWDALWEPFMWQVRELGEGKGVKILWWFVAVVDGDGDGEGGGGEEGVESEWVEVGEACGMLGFESDREVVRGAVRVLADTLGCGVGV
ncbi:hypothetical protein HBH64_027420 [Parastagonospora nodorum]|nr:hypothetical protein HBH47_054910 [Parastagonospora nodorum]KAH4294487.1 hypothetical protein HBI02_178190 [Parastagonospora nodorum]KAH4306980.1 hypothetical protein HBI01_051390 [Parastagonospora nodorum]KAH4336952.1 hypothetical protein HBI00_014990 [Parastagonospora nodorum]KAH4382686.1 hypothetical protein HBH94_059520 [Parastagonospora nodorum]